MRKEYDFSKGIKNPYIKRLKKQITIRLDDSTIEYFKALAEETDISYQNLMNFYFTGGYIQNNGGNLLVLQLFG